MDKRIMPRIILIAFVLLALPIILNQMMTLPVFSDASGTVDGWLSYWGGYLGAIVGASVVYFVAQLQIKKQYDLQIEAIRLESNHSTSREMEKFLITTRLNKYEEMIRVCERLLNTTTKINNEFVKYVTYTDIINNKESPEREEEFKRKVYEIKKKHRECHSLIMLNAIELEALYNYSPDIKDFCLEIVIMLDGLWAEAKNCYLSKDEYKEYLDPNEPYLLENAEDLMNSLVSLIKVLNNKISNELTEMEKMIL